MTNKLKIPEKYLVDPVYPKNWLKALSFDLALRYFDDDEVEDDWLREIETG